MKKFLSFRIEVLMMGAMVPFVVSCAIPNHAQRDYLMHLRSKGNTVDVTNSNFDSAWDRARTFVHTYSPYPIKLNDDSSIETSKPCAFCKGYGYSITANQRSDSTRSIHVFYRPPLWRSINFFDDSYYNVFILAEYIRTGRIDHPELISK